MFARFALLLALVGATVPIALPAAARFETDPRALVENGEILPLDAVRKRIIAQVRGDYLGFEWDPGTRIYRFRFLVNGNVINVDVDARTGQRLRPKRY